MAQLNDLLVLGNAKLINGLGILGTLNADSILPNITDTYVLGENGKRWKSAHIKNLVSDDINVTNYATIGAGQAATGINTGALRISGGLSTTQKSYFGAEIATNSTITSSLSTSTHLAGNKGTAIINSTAGGAGYNMLAKMNSTNGVWTLGGWTTGFYLFYTANSVITAGTNSYTKQLKLLDESGNSSFPGTVIATTFSGALSGNASTATTLQTARTINGTSFNGSANITTANWGTARNFTISDSSQTNKGTAVSVNGSGAVNLLLPATIQATLSGNASSASVLGQDSRMNYGWNGVNYFNISGTAGNAAKTNDTPTTAWWHIMRFNHANSSGYYTDLAIPFNANSLYYKRIGNGSVQNSGWVKVLDALNYTDYTVTKTGSGASGTWGINITGSSASCTGNAATATALKDKTNGTASYLNYGSSGMSSASWYGAWDGYTLRAISPANLATHLATTTLDARYVNISGDTMTGPLTISHATTATMTSATTNPRIIFSESGTQPVALVYTDYDSYRSPAGLKVLGMSSDASKAWFEVEGKIYSDGKLVMTAGNFSLSGTTLTITTT